MDLHADACVVGGGPCGLMLALLLARAGVAVTVLEKHADFLRDFRGDTVHPSTLALLDELGLGDRFQALPHRKVELARATFADGTFTLADFTRLPGAHPYVAFVPQSEFLELLATEASRLPEFTLLRSTEVIELLRDGDAVGGVIARRADTGEEVAVRAGLTVAADGRDSTVRRLLGWQAKEFGVPQDVLWFRVSRREGDAEGLDIRFGPRGVLVCIDRGSYWQCALSIPKGTGEAMSARGLPGFHDAVKRLAPHFDNRIEEVVDWETVKTLSVRVDRLRRWHAPGVLVLGDAAHAMSPVGGVGINLAIQDAVAAARLLGTELRAGRATTAALARVRRRRWLPTAGTQLVQRVLAHAVIRRALRSDRPLRAPVALRLLDRFPTLQAAPARAVGLGIRTEPPHSTRASGGR